MTENVAIVVLIGAEDDAFRSVVHQSQIFEILQLFLGQNLLELSLRRQSILLQEETSDAKEEVELALSPVDGLYIEVELGLLLVAHQAPSAHGNV